MSLSTLFVIGLGGLHTATRMFSEAPTSLVAGALLYAPRWEVGSFFPGFRVRGLGFGVEGFRV